ncbi:MAG TPA: hypothetical protein VGC13_20250 [Longimicrobium sp.]|jgi:hypothetical protein|uniref:hypothetical protein n=1 Tax=Longimicrobium sp. TaxID=2029185 RepID=UPI002EDB224A
MMKSKTLLLAGFGAAALVVAAERSGAQDRVGGVPGTYALARVDGRALPAVVEADGACRDELLSGTLALADGAWTLETVERETCEGQAPREDRETERGRYTVSGQAVTFAADESDDADDADDAAGSAGAAVSDADVDVDEPATGTMDGATLTVRLREGQTVVFRR